MPDDNPAEAEKTNTTMTSRRKVIGAAGIAGASLLAAHEPAQAIIGVPLREPLPPPAPAPLSELVNVFEYEDQARLAVGAAKMAPAAGSDRTVTDRITLRPRMNIPTRELDLTASLFGDQHFTPIIVGPMADQKRFHPDGEIATARGVHVGSVTHLSSI
jgi:hypothetical protein